jgi:Domain of unknown function (DUF397)
MPDLENDLAHLVRDHREFKGSVPGRLPDGPLTLVVSRERDVTEGSGVMNRCGVWFKSSASGTGMQCVEARLRRDGGVDVRDSKNRDGAVLAFTQGEWDAFLAGVLKGEFDLS